MTLLRVAIVDSVDETREAIHRELLQCSDRAWLEADCQRYEVFVDVVQQMRPDVAIVSIDGDQTLSLPLIQNLSNTFPDLAIVAMSTNADGRFILDLLRRGVKEVVPLPFREGELMEALVRITPTGGPKSSTHLIPRKVLAFTGAHGGVGATSLAVNVGCILAQDPNYSVVIVDLDLFMGDVHVCLDISPRSTLAQAVESIDQIDGQWLRRACVQHKSGLHVLAHPEQLSEVTNIDPNHITRIITLMKRNFTHVLLDLSKACLPTDLAAMEAADEIILVIQLNMSAMFNVLRLARSLEVDRPGLLEKLRLVVNRAGAEGSITLQKAEETLELEIPYQIPNDTKTMHQSRDSGKPLCEYAPNSRVFQAIAGMTNALIGRDRPNTSKSTAPSPKDGKRSILGSIFGGQR